MTAKTSKLDFRLADDARADLDTLAKRNGRTLGAEMRAALAAWLEQHARSEET